MSFIDKMSIRLSRIEKSDIFMLIALLLIIATMIFKMLNEFKVIDLWYCLSISYLLFVFFIELKSR